MEHWYQHCQVLVSTLREIEFRGYDMKTVEMKWVIRGDDEVYDILDDALDAAEPGDVIERVFLVGENQKEEPTDEGDQE